MSASPSLPGEQEQADSPALLQYSYVGDTVNTASRIERMTRTLDRTLLVSGTTLDHAGGSAAFQAEPVGDTPLRGKRETLPLWAVSANRWSTQPRLEVTGMRSSVKKPDEDARGPPAALHGPYTQGAK